MAPADLALARRVIAGEESAFEEFFAAYFPRLYRFARVRLGGNEDAAEDVVQTTLIKALDKLHTYRGEAELFTWLCTFCRWEIAAWFKRAGRIPDVSLEDDRPETRAVLDAIAALSRDDPERELHRRELTRLVQAVLDRLPSRYGDALEWKYIEGLSVQEIARRLDLGYKAAESLLTRARHAFREAFGLVAAGQLDRGRLEPGPTEP
jgi:RNA polymerase sigma-70 factor (ECF subfamily)